MNNKWECYLCGKEDDFDILPDGYLANYHPLCICCVNQILENKNHRDRFRLTYHSKLGDLKIIKDIPVQNNYLMKN